MALGASSSGMGLREAGLAVELVTRLHKDRAEGNVRAVLEGLGLQAIESLLPGCAAVARLQLASILSFGGTESSWEGRVQLRPPSTKLSLESFWYVSSSESDLQAHLET